MVDMDHLEKLAEWIDGLWIDDDSRQRATVVVHAAVAELRDLREIRDGFAQQLSGIELQMKVFRAECVTQGERAEAAEAELRALRSYPPSPDWRPIATIPRDGTKVLCWLEGEIATAYYRDDYRGRRELGNRGWSYAGWRMPTHWMPMPGGPGEAVSQAKGDADHGD